MRVISCNFHITYVPVLTGAPGSTLSPLVTNHHSDQWARISHDNIIKTHQDIATLRPEKHVFSVK